MLTVTDEDRGHRPSARRVLVDSGASDVVDTFLRKDCGLSETLLRRTERDVLILMLDEPLYSLLITAVSFEYQLFYARRSLYCHVSYYKQEQS